MKFELDRLTEYSDDALLSEVRRVAALIPTGSLRSSVFNQHSKVHSSTIGRRFGDWRKALIAAGIGDRFDDSTEAWTRDEVVQALRTLADAQEDGVVTKALLRQRYGISDRPIRRLFGSYRKALEVAGLRQARGGVRYTDEECFENLLAIWTAHGRQPRFGEMNSHPSRVGSKAYVIRWGSWRSALAAFVERMNESQLTIEEATPTIVSASNCPDLVRARTPRGPSMGLRYTVLQRDRFRCVLCGRSPATHAISLHVDHVIPWSRGGETTAENLRRLCDECNLGRGTKQDV